MLQWGNNHFLHFTRAATVIGQLHITKKSSQIIPISIPFDVTIRMIKDAWDAQDKRWIDLDPPKGSSSSFRVTRVIWFPNDRGAILWEIRHIDDHPYDTAGWTRLTRAIAAKM